MVDPALTWLRYSQLEGHLAGLKRDSQQLEALVAKYGKIHDEGAGRRLLFTLKESGGLVDLRRRIGLHEQMLQMWYMTLVYGSLRRLEGGQEHILKAIEAMKGWSPRKVEHVQRSLRKGDVKTLERELGKSGLGPRDVDAALEVAVDYVDAAPLEKARMESRARSSTTVRPEANSFPFPSHSAYQDFTFESSRDHARESFPSEPRDRRRKSSTPHIPPQFSFETHEAYGDDYEPRRSPGRSRHRNDERDKHHKKEEDKEELLRKARRDRNRVEKEDDEEIMIKERTNASRSRPKAATTLTVDPNLGTRPRSSSQTIINPTLSPPPPPTTRLLLVPDTRHRPASYHDSSDRYYEQRRRTNSDAGHRSVVEEQKSFVTIERIPQRHRSVSREVYPVVDRDRDRDRDPHRRDLSVHSFTRRRSSSRGPTGGGE